MGKNIIIKGARENNLQNINVEIPRNQITTFTGVSGSGKSSLVFKTINAEAQRQLIETFSTFAQSRLPKFKQPDCDEIKNISPVILFDQKRTTGSSRSTVGSLSDTNAYIRLLFSRMGQPQIGPSNYFSSTDPDGMCSKCNGSGKVVGLKTSELLDYSKSLNEGAILFDDYKVGSIMYKQLVMTNFFDENLPLSNYDAKTLELLLYGKDIRVIYGDTLAGNYEGIIPKINKLFLNKDINSLSKKKQTTIRKFTTIKDCEVCHGQRLKPESLAVTIAGKNIAEVYQMSLIEVLDYLNTIDVELMSDLILKIKNKIENMINIGVGYLSLSREAKTLSGGELQRVKLAKQLNCSLTEMLYILDEPSVGLHARDVDLLNKLFKKLADNDNTVLIVEHDPDIIKKSDYIIDVGPAAGDKGGEIVFCGPYNQLLTANTLTSNYLYQKIDYPKQRRVATEYFKIKNASSNNLKNISVDIPKNLITTITGVAGSGKSSLIHNEFLRHYPDAIVIDQSAVGQSIRSTVATYIKAFDIIRKLFAEANAITADIFSFNSKGACNKCKGTGIIELEMAFMDKIKTPCDKCNGTRYQKQVLQYTYNGLAINQVLDLTIDQAIEFFTDAKLLKILKMASEVGIGYLRLGQSLSTLSGGECQRIKLSSELHKEGNVYVLDEPTTGLHMSDIKKLLILFERLVNNNNTLIIIEHNLDVIENSDYLIDIGPEGGSLGGNVIFQGTPKAIVKCRDSYTGKYLLKQQKSRKIKAKEGEEDGASIF